MDAPVFILTFGSGHKLVEDVLLDGADGDFGAAAHGLTVDLGTAEGES